MKNLILEWQKRQQKYEELAEKYKDDAHNNKKFTYKAMATRDCWKELALQLQQTGVSGSILMNILENNYELNRQFHEELRESIYSFCVAHYNETMTFENWLATYYR